jgi:hypothetical protein
LDLGQMSRKGATLFHISNGMVTRLVPYFDRDRALADLGLEAYAVSERNVEVLRELLDEFATTHRVAERLSTPDFVWDMGSFGGWPEKQEYIGPAEFYEFFAAWTGPYEDWDMAAPDLRELDHDRVLGLLIQRGRLRGADSWDELHYGVIVTVNRGLMSRVQVFGTWEAALEAAGL